MAERRDNCIIIWKTYAKSKESILARERGRKRESKKGGKRKRETDR